jgi:hypothetical protein
MLAAAVFSFRPNKKKGDKGKIPLSRSISVKKAGKSLAAIFLSDQGRSEGEGANELARGGLGIM